MIQTRTIEAHELGSVLESLRIRGRNVGEGLDRFGALLTRERHLKIQADTIQEIADLFSTTSAHQWTGGRGSTQMDLMHAIVAKLEQLAQDRRNDHHALY